MDVDANEPKDRAISALTVTGSWDRGQRAPLHRLDLILDPVSKPT